MAEPAGPAFDLREARLVAVGRVVSATTAVCSLAGLGIYLALGLHDRLFTDWMFQIAVFGVLIAALCWPLLRGQPRNGAVWALLCVAVSTAIQALATGLLQRELAVLGLAPDLARLVPAELPLTTALYHQTASWGWVAGNFAFILALMVFPDGRLLSPRWRAAAHGVVVGAVFATGTMAWIGRPSSSVSPMSDDLLAVLPPGERVAMIGALTVMVACALASFAALVARYRASSGQVRAQLRWIAWATTLIVVEALILFPLMYTRAAIDLYRYTSIFTFAVFIGAYVVAISRYRLYEVDRLISRTVSYGIVTALLAGVYVSAVLAAQAVVGTSREERSTIVVAGSTLLVAALFGPVRRRTKQIVDRRFNRRVRDATEVVAAFGERLRDEIALGTLVEELQRTSATIAEPTSVAVWLPPGSRTAPNSARAAASRSTFF